MPTAQYEALSGSLYVEEAGVFYLPGLKSPASGKPLVRVDMDVVLNFVRSNDNSWGADEGDKDKSLVRKVGDQLAQSLSFIVLAELLKQEPMPEFTTREAAFEEEQQAQGKVIRRIQDEIDRRPSKEEAPYASYLRYYGEVLDVLLVGSDKTDWLIYDKEVGLHRFISTRKTHAQTKIPPDMWKTHFHFCKHKHCRDPGCPCVCHTDGRNILFATPLEWYGSDTLDDLLLKWAHVTTMVATMLHNKAQQDGRRHDMYMAQAEGVELGYDWLCNELWDEDEHVYMRALTVSMFYMFKSFVDFD